MAHDRQIAEERERSNVLSKPTSKASASLDVLADWWQVYGQIYRDDPTELLAMAFRETLKDLAPSVLHQACLRAQRESPQFRPTPGRIYEIAEAILERTKPGNRPKYLDEPAPMTREEREQAVREFPIKLLPAKPCLPSCLCRKCRERRAVQP